MSYEEWPTNNFGGMPNRSVMGEIPVNRADPIHQALVRRKLCGDDPIKDIEVQTFPEEDIKALEIFCRNHGVFGFNFGRMHPKIALRMLKAKMGIPEHIEAVSPSPIKQLIHG